MVRGTKEMMQPCLIYLHAISLVHRLESHLHVISSVQAHRRCCDGGGCPRACGGASGGGGGCSKYCGCCRLGVPLNRACAAREVEWSPPPKRRHAGRLDSGWIISLVASSRTYCWMMV